MKRHAALCAIALFVSTTAGAAGHADAEGTPGGAATVSKHGHMAEDPLRALVLADRLEWRSDGRDDSVAWDVTGWIGKDENRLWLRTEGEHARGDTESADVEALWGRPLSRWWDLLVGVRHDFEPGEPRTRAAFGVIGLAPYGFEAQVTAYADVHGATLLQAEVEYDLLVTQRLVLQPRVELKFHGRDDPSRDIAAGLSHALGMRLRYEIAREFAPYAGVEWSRSGAGASDRIEFVAGLRVWL